MYKKRLLIAPILASLSSISANAEVLKGTGIPMTFDAGYGVKVNEGSSLEREWVIVNDDGFPIKLTEIFPKTRYVDRNWIFEVTYAVEVSEPISAVEVRFIPFDVWGNKDRALSTTIIKDMPAGEIRNSGKWRILSENTAVEHYAMLGYIAQVKLASGAILKADNSTVVDAAQQFSRDFTSGDLSAD